MKEKEQLIEGYFQGTLSKEEQILFDSKLKNDSIFKETFDFHLDVRQAIKDEDRSNFKSFIRKIEKENERSQRKPVYIRWIAAASIAMLLGLYYFVNTNTVTPSNEVLFSEYFEPYRNVIYPLERNGQSKNEKALAFETYEIGDYENAALLFSKLYEKNKESYALFYQANALLKLEKTKEALSLLIQHTKVEDDLNEKTSWYLALTYLKLGDWSTAKKTLQEIIDQNLYNAKKAKELLEKLE